MCWGGLARNSLPAWDPPRLWPDSPPPCSWVGLPSSWPASLSRVPVVLIRTTSNVGTHKKNEKKAHTILLLAVALQMVCLSRETIVIALSGHVWVSIKDSFSSHNRVLCFGFEYKRLHSAGGKNQCSLFKTSQG